MLGTDEQLSNGVEVHVIGIDDGDQVFPDAIKGKAVGNSKKMEYLLLFLFLEFLSIYIYFAGSKLYIRRVENDGFNRVDCL